MRSRGSDRGAYIGEMAAELAKMARADGRNTLGYLLEIAALEARAEGFAEGFQLAGRKQHEVEQL